MQKLDTLYLLVIHMRRQFKACASSVCRDRRKESINWLLDRVNMGLTEERT